MIAEDAEYVKRSRLQTAQGAAQGYAQCHSGYGGAPAKGPESA